MIIWFWISYSASADTLIVHGFFLACFHSFSWNSQRILTLSHTCFNFSAFFVWFTQHIKRHSHFALHSQAYAVIGSFKKFSEYFKIFSRWFCVTHTFNSMAIFFVPSISPKRFLSAIFQILSYNNNVMIIIMNKLQNLQGESPEEYLISFNNIFQLSWKTSVDFTKLCINCRICKYCGANMFCIQWMQNWIWFRAVYFCGSW